MSVSSLFFTKISPSEYLIVCFFEEFILHRCTSLWDHVGYGCKMFPRILHDLVLFRGRLAGEFYVPTSRRLNCESLRFSRKIHSCFLSCMSLVDLFMFIDKYTVVQGAEKTAKNKNFSLSLSLSLCGCAVVFVDMCRNEEGVFSKISSCFIARAWSGVDSWSAYSTSIETVVDIFHRYLRTSDLFNQRTPPSLDEVKSIIKSCIYGVLYGSNFIFVLFVVCYIGWTI